MNKTLVKRELKVHVYLSESYIRLTHTLYG